MDISLVIIVERRKLSGEPFGDKITAHAVLLHMNYDHLKHDPIVWKKGMVL